jgi:hypothetical protein
VSEQPSYRFFSPKFVPFTILGHALILLGFVASAVWALLGEGGSGDSWFWLLFLPTGAGIIWVNLFKIAFELRIEDQLLRWRSPLWSGELRCDQILSVSNVLGSWPWPMVRIRPSDGPSVYINAKRPLRDFVDALLVENHSIEVDAKSYRSWRWMGPFDRSRPDSSRRVR